LKKAGMKAKKYYRYEILLSRIAYFLNSYYSEQGFIFLYINNDIPTVIYAKY